MHKFYIVYFKILSTVDYHLFDDYIVLVSSRIVFTLLSILFYSVLLSSHMNLYTGCLSNLTGSPNLCVDL